jgi:hypothetical protein
MTFLYPLMLGGLVAVGLPILLHLLMRQKPKHVMFPAFRFLQQKAKRNQRKIRLRHLLLLLLRMLLLALICLALAKPRVFSDRVGPIGGANQAAAAVLVVDTSLSMDYQSGGKSRLDDAKQRALELLDEFSENSRVAVVDTADPVREWMSVPQAREKVRGLTTKAGSQAVTTAMPGAYALFDELDRESTPGETEALPRFIYVLSDRTVAAWDSTRVPDLTTQRDRQPAPGVTSYFIDVGVEKPADVAITAVNLKPQSIPAGQDVVLNATVAATGQACDGEIVCKFLGANGVEIKPVERKPIKLAAGQTDVVEFRRKDLKPGQYQAELTLAPTDALPADNARYVTFEVRIPRKVVIITDDEDYALFVEAAILSAKEFDCDTVTPDKIQSADDLKPYRAAFLLSVRSPDDLWAKLETYVAGGGHLLVMPGRDDTVPGQYTPAASKNLLPVALDKPVAVPGEKGAAWRFGNFKHPMLKIFGEWDQAGVSFMRSPRTATKYWSVKMPDGKPIDKRNVIVSYALKDDPPALLERVVDRGKDAGRVLLFTTSFDDRGKAKEPPWNNYAVTIDAPFLVPVVNEALKYCAGSLADVTFNYTSGQALALPLPQDARFPDYQIDGPGLSGGDTKLARTETDAELRVRKTEFAGNYSVSHPGSEWKAKFSLNPPANEFQLDRVAAEEIEKLFGPESVVAPESNKKITEVTGAKSRRPLDLFAALMVLFVLAFCVECFLANRFYKAEDKPAEA